MKKILLALILFTISSCYCGPGYYTVVVTYCDGRPNDTVSVPATLCDEPNNHSIDNYKRAVPTWNGHMNVCEVKTINRPNN